LLCHLQLAPINYAQNFFLRPGGAPAFTAPPGYAYVLGSKYTKIVFAVEPRPQTHLEPRKRVWWLQMLFFPAGGS